MKADHFEDLEQQAHAARLGMWIFLASEVLLFAALFGLFAAYRVEHHAAFDEAVHHNTKTHGSINTAVLLVSSALVALSVHAMRAGSRRAACAFGGGTIALGLVFLAIKLDEYRLHFAEGIYPGGSGAWFATHGKRGSAEFWTLYYGMTGVHAVHVILGISVLSVLLLRAFRGRMPAPYPLELGALYWHLVDTVWIFLWPLFYLA
ncbi:MAG: cytochrome c oxidase subunit 3 [Labilithrix sp.]|nr:cytochrome c oxidase subunit 3 [Labilithrix sp.]